MTEFKSIRTEFSDGSNGTCVIEVTTVPSPWLRVSQDKGEILEFNARDLFEALIILRKHMEKYGVKLLCVGSRVDVFPSGMSREMSKGRKAFVKRLGSHPTGTDLVDIFDYASADTIGTVSEQREFHEKWKRSI